jgi:hypothetical protein
MSKHTPGPWELRPYTAADSAGWCIRLEGERDIDIDEYSDESRGNAHLIAAAPELLETLEALLRPTYTAEDVSRAVMAVRKAKGEA